MYMLVLTTITEESYVMFGTVVSWLRHQIKSKEL